MQINFVMFKEDERRDFPMKSKRVVIGRMLEADLRIPTSDVSREHCEITHNDVVLTVKDLGSANGTFVNGRRVTEGQLRAGDKLGVGPVIFVVQIDGNPPKVTPHDAKVEPEVAAVEAIKAGLDDTPDFNDDIFAEIVGKKPAAGDDEEEFDLDALEILDEEDEPPTRKK